MTVENEIVGVVSGADGRNVKPWLYRSAIKRPLDILLVLLTSPVVLPIVLLFALLVLRDGGRPFYSQPRIGQNGRTYRIWKLRSMVEDADQHLASYLAKHPEAEREWISTQKLRQDPRVTRFGRFLRRSSMDELPQLWNVLKGDMSLVGPRPMMPTQQEYYEGTAYYSLRPGITGYWQVSDRNRTTFSARAMYDDIYDRNLSFSGDVAILFRTVGVVMRATGC